eukprot:c14836_g1_i1.p1 GENE.c14836_g1_i1~~c14836_g1_i1.p1  ORF type:complete len:491 (-),score=113.99 c14836_g1_i1:23-1495(-)
MLHNHLFLNIILILSSIISFSHGWLQLTATNNSAKLFKDFITPPFDLGNLNFPVSGAPIFVKGCNGLSRMVSDELITIPSTDTIVFVESDIADNSCWAGSFIFQCQSLSWCRGIVIEDPFFTPTGLATWSYFDKRRDRTQYKVPYLQTTKEDFSTFQKLVQLTYANQQPIVTIFGDTNPWSEMFDSGLFVFMFQVLSTLWSFFCLFLSVFLLRKKYSKTSYNKNRTSSLMTPSQFTRHESRNSFSLLLQSKKSLKTICLCLKIFTHTFRIFYFAVDPFFSQQVYPSLASYLLLTATFSFEICTNILFSFIIRELTQATTIISIFTKAKFSLIFVLGFLILDFWTAIEAGLFISIGIFPSWIVKAFFYLILNICLGGWYFWQARRFLKKSIRSEKKFRKENKARECLTQISTVSSFGMILCGILFSFMSIREVFGSPWGYFGVFCAITVVSQITSLAQIFLLSHTLITVKTVREFFEQQKVRHMTRSEISL